MSSASAENARVDAERFASLFDELKTWHRWGEDDQRGALNFLSQTRVAAAAQLVREGVTVTLSLRVNTVRAPHNPVPADHHMTATGGAGGRPGEIHFIKDYIGADYHHDGHTHIDALCHVGYGGRLYNGFPEDSVGDACAPVDSIEALERGLVGRGVLLDIPRLRAVPWLEPGENVMLADLVEAERAQGVAVGEGDILLVRTGHVRRLAELGPWETAETKAGVHPLALRFVSERAVSALGSDGNNDTAPSNTEGVAFPIHVLAINAMGVHLLDYLQLEDLAGKCEQAGRWEFLFVAAPLRIVGGTGSPINPIAVF